jgi:phospholipid transport system substrate-binding protein
MKRAGGLLALLLLMGPATTQAEERRPPNEAGAATAAAGRDSGLPREDAAAARAVVEGFHGVLLGSMREADALGFQGRYDRIFSALGESFDLPMMARSALGSTWKQLEDQQLSEFITLSQRLSAARYADNFDGYDGQRFETRSEKPAARGTMLVRTELVQPKDDDVKFDYRLRRTSDGWRIIDVQLDGVISELAMRRAQYRSLIEREGFERLVEVMESRIEELSAP